MVKQKVTNAFRYVVRSLVCGPRYHVAFPVDFIFTPDRKFIGALCMRMKTESDVLLLIVWKKYSK